MFSVYRFSTKLGLRSTSARPCACIRNNPTHTHTHVCVCVCVRACVCPPPPLQHLGIPHAFVSVTILCEGIRGIDHDLCVIHMFICLHKCIHKLTNTRMWLLASVLQGGVCTDPYHVCLFVTALWSIRGSGSQRSIRRLPGSGQVQCTPWRNFPHKLSLAGRGLRVVGLQSQLSLWGYIWFQ